MSYRHYPPAGRLLIGYDPEDVLPKRHLARFVDSIVEKCLVPEDAPVQVGRKEYDPRLLAKVMIYGYATGVRSSRLLEKNCVESLPYRYLTRGDTPSYHTLSTARINMKGTLELCWVEMLAVAERLKIPRVGRIDLDSTKIRANVSSESVVPKADLQPMLDLFVEILAEVEKQDSLEDAEGYSGQTVLDIAASDEQVEEALRQTRKVAKRAEAGGDQMREVLRKSRKKIRQKDGEEQPAIEPISLGPKMVEQLKSAVATLQDAVETGRKHVSLTDPDAEMMTEGRNKKVVECHSLEVAVDSGVLVCAATSQTGADANRLMGIVEAAKKHEPRGVTGVTGDSGYYGTDNVVALEESGIVTCIPDAYTACEMRRGLPLGSMKEKLTGGVEMTYDPDANCYRCPEGNVLVFNQERKSEGQVVSYYRAKNDCSQCPLKAQCLKHDNSKRRVLKVGEHREEIKTILRRFEDPEHRQRYHDRGKNVETVFAFCRSVLGFTRWMLRGKEKVAAEGALFATAFQLRKLNSAMRAAA